MAPIVRAVWWWSVQVAHNVHYQHHQGGQAQYGRVVGRRETVAASATRKRNDGFMHGKPVVLWTLTYLPTQFTRQSLIGKARQLASPRPWLYLWFCMDIITCQCTSPEMDFLLSEVTAHLPNPALKAPWHKRAPWVLL